MKLLLLLCILFISKVFAKFDFEHVVSVKKENDIIRSYSYLQTFNGFFLAGSSLNGTISKDNTTAEFDTSIFRFDAGNIIGYPTYSWFYLHGKLSIDQTNSSLEKASLTSVFVPTFIVEYVENGDEDGLQIDQDEMVGYVNLGALKYKTEKTEETLKDDDDNDFKVFHITATSTTGLVQFNFTVSDQPSKINDSTIISAQQTKIDIGIFGYYDETANPVDESLKCTILTMLDKKCTSTGASNKNSTLAILSFYGVNNFGMKFESEHEHPEEHDGEIKVENEDEQGFSAGFSWINKARAQFNGTDHKGEIECQVHSNVTDSDGDRFGSTSIKSIIKNNGSHKFIIFSFPNVTRPDSIIYDPIIGTAGANNNNNGSSTGSTIDSDGSNASRNIISISFALIMILVLLL